MVLHSCIVWFGCIAGCNDGSTDPAEVSSSARVLGLFSTELPDGHVAQARQALRADAWRREHRFRDAADPGYLFAATRVEQAEIDEGLWDPQSLYQLGGQLFTLSFDRSVGFGAGDSSTPRRFHDGARGGPDAHRCADCHWRGGLAGAGDGADNAFLRGDGARQSSAIARNPPPLHGAGVLELLASEMSQELSLQREEILEFVRTQDHPIRVEMMAKGVSFGFVVARPDGSFDASELDGVDEDLQIKPFGWKGTFATVRDVSEDALAIHHGMQSQYLVSTADPERIGNGPQDDPDADGITDEVTEGQVTALSIFAALQDIPIEDPPADTEQLLLYAEGRAAFERLGCADCHVPSMRLSSTRWSLPARRTDGPDLVIDLAREGAEPRLEPDEDGGVEVRLYSDLKRHDMGPLLAEDRSEAGVPGSHFITPPLWGIARSRPYLHDGRAPTLEDAILLHGGEAQASAEAFAALSEEERAPLRIFLTSLTRAGRMVAH